MRVAITPGQANDKTMVAELLEGFPASHLIADRGYDSRAIIALVAAK